jgi:hypothetical protein
MILDFQKTMFNLRLFFENKIIENFELKFSKTENDIESSCLNQLICEEIYNNFKHYKTKY